MFDQYSQKNISANELSVSLVHISFGQISLSQSFGRWAQSCKFYLWENLFGKKYQKNLLSYFVTSLPSFSFDLMEKLSEEEPYLLNNSKKLQSLYDKLLPSLEKHIVRNSGTDDDAKDIFQEAVIIAYRKLKDPEFELTSSIETFIYSIAKKKWLYELKKRRKNIPYIETNSEITDQPIDKVVRDNEQIDLYLNHFKKLPKSCQEILNLFFNGLKMSKIAEKLNFGSEGYARKRKHKCQEKLIKAIKEDCLFNELKK